MLQDSSVQGYAGVAYVKEKSGTGALSDLYGRQERQGGTETYVPNVHVFSVDTKDILGSEGSWRSWNDGLGDGNVK
jgi:hypothetical protein